MNEQIIFDVASILSAVNAANNDNKVEDETPANIATEPDIPVANEENSTPNDEADEGGEESRTEVNDDVSTEENTVTDETEEAEPTDDSDPVADDGEVSEDFEEEEDFSPEQFDEETDYELPDAEEDINDPLDVDPYTDLEFEEEPVKLEEPESDFDQPVLEVNYSDVSADYAPDGEDEVYVAAAELQEAYTDIPDFMDGDARLLDVLDDLTNEYISSMFIQNTIYAEGDGLEEEELLFEGGFVVQTEVYLEDPADTLD